MPLEDRSIIAIPAGTTITANVMPGFSYVGAVVPASNWAAARMDESGEWTMQSSGQVVAKRLQAKHVHAIKHQLDHTIGQLDSAAAKGAVDLSAVLSDYTALLAEAFEGCVGSDDSAGLAKRSRIRHAQLAKDWIHANLDQPISVVHLSKLLGISRRQLEYSFRDAFDMSPHEYISALQLNEIYRALRKVRTTNDTVTDIALQFGVRHLSRFSARYRQLFGELPSQTRRSTRVKT